MNVEKMRAAVGRSKVAAAQLRQRQRELDDELRWTLARATSLHIGQLVRHRSTDVLGEITGFGTGGGRTEFALRYFGPKPPTGPVAPFPIRARDTGTGVVVHEVVEMVVSGKDLRDWVTV